MFLKISKHNIYKHDFGQFSLIGTSVAAHATAFFIPELKIAFDAGAIVSGQQPDIVLISHGHSDHCHDIHYFGSVSKKPIYYIPKKVEGFLEDYLLSLKKLSKCDGFNISSEPDHVIVGVTPNDSFNFKRGDINYFIKVYECKHSVPSVGYGIVENRKKLLPELLGLPVKDLRKLNENEKYYFKPIKLICFLGDTMIDVFEMNPEILDYPIVVVECTFLEASELENAHSKNHICWSELLPIVIKNPKVTFVLIHFSDKYKNEYIETFFNHIKFFKNIKNILPWVNLKS